MRYVKISLITPQKYMSESDQDKTHKRQNSLVIYRN